jgi:hypothetical protein
LKLRAAWLVLTVLLAVAAGTTPARAQDPRLEALGGATLAVDMDTTQLSLFNLGNPAGAAFLPQKDRMDLALRVAERERAAEFTTQYPHSVDQKVQIGQHEEYNSVTNVTTTVADYAHNFIYNLDPYGNSTYVDTFGNTLDPFTLFSRHSSTLSATLDDWGSTGYGGYLTWLSPEVILQLVPVGAGAYVSSADQPSSTSGFIGGGTVRSAWLAAPDLTFGAGLTGLTGFAQGWGQPDRTPEASAVTTNPRAHYFHDERHFGAQLGAGWRVAAVFDPEDHMDLGLALNAGRRWRTYEEDLHAGLSGTGPKVSGMDVGEEAQPAELRLQGVYTYRSALDIALDTGYQSERLYRSLTSDTLPSYDRYMSEAQERLDYELTLKVRMPMVRDDDLRFGIVFNNRPVNHPYPGGKFRQYLPSGLYADDPIQTSSSAIGIATGVVPSEGSLVTLEYFLGSAKSRQDTTVVIASGYTRFNLGVQYLVVEGLTVRAGYSNLRNGYQWTDRRIARDESNNLVWDPNAGPINPTTGYHTGDYTWETATLTRSIEFSSYRFGVSVGDKPWRLDLTLMAENVSPSPYGWTMLDKPASLEITSQDKDVRYSANLGLSWFF